MDALIATGARRSCADTQERRSRVALFALPALPNRRVERQLHPLPGMRNLSMLLLAAAALSLGPACATQEQTGAVAGAGVGAAAGNALTRGSLVGTLLGAAVGAAVGSDIGRQLDEADRREAAHALETYPTGEEYDWVNPDTGRRYEVTPTRTFEGQHGPCRDFVLLTSMDGEPAEIRGTACRTPDGTWHTIEE
jgi:surface antigen